MPFDIEDITGTDPGKGAKPSSGFDPSDVKAAAQSGTGQTSQNLIAGTIDPNTQFSEFRFQPKTNADNYLLRAQDQGFWETAGKTLGNVLANIPLDVAQGLGYLATTLEIGNERDYNNNLTKEIEKLKNPFGEVYRENPNTTWDPGDSAWWFEHLGGLVESATSFAIQGAGIAKIFGNLAKAAAWSAKSAKIGSRIAQGLSAGTLSYMEGAMSGARVYETAYDNNYMKLYEQGVDPADADLQARQIASQAAAATVQIHTAMNMGLNLTGLAPMFRNSDQAIVSWWRRNGKPLPGESAAQWQSRLAQAVPDGMPLKKLLGLGMQGPSRLGLEAIQEGLEEVNTQYAENVGQAIGEGKEQKDVASRLFDLDRYFSEVLNEEGALNMALGALGGIAQTVIMDNVPVHKVIKYGADGQPLLHNGQVQTERVSSNTMNERMSRQYFDNIKDALTKDMTWFSEKNQELAQAMSNKNLADVARLKSEILSVHNLRAISMGMGDVWKQQYEDISRLDNSRSLSDDLNAPIEEITQQMQDAFNEGRVDEANALNQQRMQLMDQQTTLQGVTEAMQKGFAENITDNNYQQQAQKAIQNLNYLTDLYQKMQDKYTGTSELDESGVSEHMFYRQANLYLHKQQIDKIQEDLMKLKSQVDELTFSQEDDLLIKQAKDFIAEKAVWENTVKKLNNDIARLNEAVRTNNQKSFLQIMDKYKIPATPDAGKKLVKTLERRKEELQKRADYSSKELNDTIAVWESTNPEKSATSIIQRAAQRPALEDIYYQNKQYYQQAVTEYETAREQLEEDSTNEAVNRYIKENKIPDQKKKQKKEHIEAYDVQVDREVAASMDAKQKQDQVAKIDADLAYNAEALRVNEQKLANLNAEYSGLRKKGFFKTFGKRATMNLEILRVEEDIAGYRLSIDRLKEARVAAVADANVAGQAAQNVSRTPAAVVQPTTPAEANIPAPNEVEQQQNDLPPEIDFSQEVTPEFTTTKEGHLVFDNFVGGTESGNTLRQFIQIQKLREVPYLIGAIKGMLQKVNLPMPTEEDFNKFIIPYVTTLRNEYVSQKTNPQEEYEKLKSLFPEDILTVLDILEGEFREHGFSYDRAMQVLNQLVKEKKIAKNLVGQIASQMKAYIEYTKAPAPTVVTEPAPITPVEPAIVQKPNPDTMSDVEFAVSLFPFFGDYSSQTQQIIFNVGNNIEFKAEAVITPFPLNNRYPGIENGKSVVNGTMADGSKIAWPWRDLRKTLNSIRLINKADQSVQKEWVRPYDAIPENYGKPAPVVTPVVTKEFNEEPTTYIPPIPDSEPTVFSNAALDMDTIKQDQKRFVGASNIEVVKANFNTHPYKEFDNGTTIKIVSDYTKLDDKVNTDVLLPGVIVPGDDVVFEVDTNWTGEINIDTEMVQDDYGEQIRRADTFQNYLEGPGKIGMSSTASHPKGAHANVPIKIVHSKTGKTIGYLPRADWVLAKYPDTGNYRNVVDEYQDEDTIVTDNVARQYGRILKLREAIVRSWNTSPGLKMTTKVSSRGTGHVMLNREVNPNTGRTKLVTRSAKNMLPDSTLELAIVKDGAVYVTSGVLSQKARSKRIPAYMKSATSLPVAMLPSPDGTYMPTPLYTHRLGDNPSSLNTVVKAIELYLKSTADQLSTQDGKIIQRITEEVGFDLRIPSELRSFVQQYFTYTQKFGEKDTVITPSEVSSANPEFMIDIPDLLPGEKASFIKIGTSFSGERPLYAHIINGQLDQDFEYALREGLKNRFKNVVFGGKELRGINSAGEFKAPIIKKDGTVQINTYQDYNEYVKANSTTFVYGLNQVSGQYVYMANPVVQLDYEKALQSAPPVVQTGIKETQQTEQQGDEQFEEPDELADLFGNGMLSPSQGSVQPLQVPSEGEQVSLELLTDLRNLTPEAHRNSKTPEQVLKELLSRGVTVLADGHNPFYIC